MENPRAHPLLNPENTPKLPAVDQILPKLIPSEEPCYTLIDAQSQELLFNNLIETFEEAHEGQETQSLVTIQPTPEQEVPPAGIDSRKIAALQEIVLYLDKLWRSDSIYFQKAVEALANGSRDPSWRIPYGKAGILSFFLNVISSKKQSNEATTLHSLRLIGNSCADTDYNRQLVVNGNHTLAIIYRILEPGLIQVAIPVLYNVCIEYEPAQSQAAANQIIYILVKLILDGAINDSLLDYAYELIELASEQKVAMECSPDETIFVLGSVAVAEATCSRFACIANCLATYLQNERLQDFCIERQTADNILCVLEHSYQISASEFSGEDEQLLAQPRLKINQALSDLSARPQFANVYPLGSSLIQRLKSWLESPQDQLLICSCVMLGNLARSDEVCEAMVNNEEIHKPLINSLKVATGGSVLHSVLGFLKNLAIASRNRSKLGEAGIIPAASHLLSYDAIPQVQFLAVSLMRQVIASSVDNISRLLECSPDEPGSDVARPTYLSVLLSLYEKTDTTPIRTETGRIVAAICRTLLPLSKRGDLMAREISDNLFRLHNKIYMPIVSMITQTEWPVVRSEGWFALALMASTSQGSEAVAHCLQEDTLFRILEETLTEDVSGGETTENERTQQAKDRDNATIALKELLGHSPGNLSETARMSFESLVSSSSIIRATS